MDFPTSVRQCTEPIVSAAVEIYGRMSTDLLPTPAKSHYVFNLRDLSKCIQGEWTVPEDLCRSTESMSSSMCIQGNFCTEIAVGKK